MIAMGTMHSTSPIARRAVLLGLSALAGCVAQSAPPGPSIMPPAELSNAFEMQDGVRLPYRTWMPPGEVRAAMLALHGFNDSRDQWALPAPVWASMGIAVYAPDQRGFGAAPGRGLWPGGNALAQDAATMTALLRRNHPGVRLVLVGESMGGAVAMLAAERFGPDADAFVLSSPAVWGRARMNVAYQAALWLASTFVPGLTVMRAPISIRASDNDAALIALGRNPLTILHTRFDTLRGLVDLMDAALAAGAAWRAPGLFLYGAHDQLVPPEATKALWRSLPPGTPRAFYPDGWHLLTRDLHRAMVIADIGAYTLSGALPEPAMQAAARWLASKG
jgi:acylglycerol lipase